jgi:hypothetical protein
MRTYTEEAVQELTNPPGSSFIQETDNIGQIVIYTNLFRWNDGTIRDQPDPTWDD